MSAESNSAVCDSGQYSSLSVVEDHVEERLMNPDAAVVLDKAQFAKAVHEKRVHVEKRKK